MHAFVVPLTVFLAVVFAVSALGKLRSADRGSASFAALQIPVRHPDAAAVALIAAEAVVAVGLVSTGGWLFVGFAAGTFVLTAGLLIVVVRAHRKGATDDCGCFGEWIPSAIGPRLILRNVMLTIAASAVLASSILVQALLGGPVGVPLALSSPSSVAPTVGALAAAALIAVATWATVRASAATPAASSPGDRGAGAVVVPETGEIVDLLAAGSRARLLVFVSPGCHACETALTALRAAEDDLNGLVDLYVVQRAASGAAGTESAHALPQAARFALDVGGSLSASLGTGRATPVAALIGTDGLQAGPLAVGSDETALLIDSIRALATAPPA